MPRAGRFTSVFWKRAGISLVSLAAAFLLAEWLFREYGPKPYAPPEFRTTGGEKTPLYEIIRTLRRSFEDAVADEGFVERPRGLIVGKGKFLQWYDRPEWDYFEEDGTIEVEINRLGFRDKDFETKRQPGEYRVLSVGDSLTFGTGVPLENTWPQLLEERLREQRGTLVEVINAGLASGSHWPPGYYPWLESDGVLLEPDVVILGICLNDMSDTVPMLAYRRPEFGLEEGDLRPWLGGASQLLNHLQLTLAQRWERQHPIDAVRLVQEDAESWAECRESMRAIRDLLEERDIRFVVTVFPMFCLLGESYPYIGLHEMMEEFCRVEGIEHMDLLSRFRGMDEEDLWVHPTDQHPNHVGHIIMADGIYQYLEANPIPPKKSPR